MTHQSRAQSPRGPKDLTAWVQLAKTAIEKAKAAEDKREHSIRLAVQKGQVEHLLRKWGIICEADILREFPPPKT